jgi:predicted dienelactone hydrolase
MNVGCRAIEAEDVVQGATVPIRLLYPTRATEQPEPFGAFKVNVAMNAPVDGEELRLVIISHGTGGTPWTHRELAAHLARSGLVAALIQHPGNNRGDDTLSGTVINLENRPRHIRVAIDAVLTDEVVGPHLARDGVTVIGHSLGGYTALAVAGGRPSAFESETLDGKPAPIRVERDPRVRALVLLAPATPWFRAEGALADVNVSIFMRTGEKDPHTDRWHAQIVERGLSDPTRLDHKVIPNAGHFSFLTPYPAEMRSPALPPSQDPEGFDRAGYLSGLYDEIVTFIHATR